MGVEIRMDLEQLVKQLKKEVEEKIEKSIIDKTDDYERKISNKTLDINTKDREVEKLNQKLKMMKDDLDGVKAAKYSLEGDYKSLENKLNAKNDDMDILNKKLASMKKKVEFKSSLEKSFESLQLQFQAKVDELEKLKRAGGVGDYQAEICLQKPAYKE